MNSCKKIDISNSISSLTQLLNKIMKTNEKNWWTNLSYQGNLRIVIKSCWAKCEKMKNLRRYMAGKRKGQRSHGRKNKWRRKGRKRKRRRRFGKVEEENEFVLWYFWPLGHVLPSFFFFYNYTYTIDYVMMYII